MNPDLLIHKYYPEDNKLRELLLLHSRLVTAKAVAIAESLNDKEIDIEFIREAAMLHDIGIVRCKAPKIYCEGTLPYIRHGIEGREILLEEGYPRHALVCERHTGSGMTAEEITTAGLPLPRRDMIPLTIEEKIICAADKFFSKSGDPRHEKTLEEISGELARFGDGSLKRWFELEKELGLRNVV